MRPKGSAAQLEARRHLALKLLDEGLSLNEVGRKLGCAPSSVMHWRNARRRGGRRALKVRPTPGRPPRLTPTQHRRLLRLLLQGAMAHGFRTELWTTQRIADLIGRVFRIRYHRDHVGRLLHRLGWSAQKPERRALERDEAAIARWKQTRWPQVKKTPRGWGPTSRSSTNRASR
ncbi:MAG: winged helix-turn-helix domain-containing protein [Nitrospirota bacterium]